MKLLYCAHRIVLAVYLIGFLVLAVDFVGEPQKDCAPATWGFPLRLMLILGAAAILGWFAAKEHYRDGQ